MKSSCSRFSFRHSTVSMLFVFILVVLISFTGTATAVYADTFTVDTTIDDVADSGSLRYAIENATSQDVITFDLEYPAIITLDEQLSIDHGLTIQGPGAELLAVSGGGECRVFYVEDTAESVDISGISIVSGDTGFYNDRKGGGIYNLSDKLSLDSCHFSGNNADYSGGGGMYNEESRPTVTNCTFYSNSADDGGGMCNFLSSPTVINCTFTENSANEGGGMYNDAADPIVTNCTFDENSTVSEGGGMYNYGSDPIVTNCTFSENSAISGGGMFNDQISSPTVTNCTFSENNAVLGGGGMSNYSDSYPIVINCIFWGDGDGEIYNANGDLSLHPTLSFCVVQSNDVGNGTISSDIISTDPNLQDLADNGGPTWTCALGEESSAIDAGITIAEVSTDQRGAPRPYNGSFDIGAYESGLEVYEIIATCSEGGTISPSEAHSLGNGTEDELFYLMPAEGYEIEVVYVDDVAIESIEIINNTFTFEDVTANHSIHADFKPGYDGDGCSISSLPGVGILLMLPLLFLSGKMK